MKTLISFLCIWTALNATAFESPLCAKITALPKIREAPPHGFMNLLIGSQVDGSFEISDTIEILEKKRVGSIWRSSDLVQHIRTPHNQDTESWIDAGIEDQRGATPRIQIIESCQ